MENREIQREMKHRVDVEETGDDTGNELIFDPTTGELLVRPRHRIRPSEGVVISDIADEGFFA